MLTPDTMRQIMWDMKRETKPDASYTDEMKRWRREAEAELAHWRIEHPEATLDIPEELADADIDVDDPYGPPTGGGAKLDEFNESDHPREENGRFGQGGGPSHPAALTDREHQLLHAMANTPKQRGSDSHVLKKIGATQGEAVALAQSARNKLGLTPQHNLRQHAIEMQKRGEIKAPAAEPSKEKPARVRSGRAPQTGPNASVESRASHASNKANSASIDVERAAPADKAKANIKAASAHEKAAQLNREVKFSDYDFAAEKHEEKAAAHKSEAEKWASFNKEAAAAVGKAKGEPAPAHGEHGAEHAAAHSAEGHGAEGHGAEGHGAEGHGEHATPPAHGEGHGEHGAAGHGEGEHEEHPGRPGESDFEKGKEEGEKEKLKLGEKVAEFAKGAGEVVAGEEAAKLAGALALFHGHGEGHEGHEGHGEHGGHEGHGAHGAHGAHGEHGPREHGHGENKLGHEPKNKKATSKAEGKPHGPKHIEKQTEAIEGHPRPTKTD